MVQVKYLKQVQKQHASERPKQYTQQNGLWKNAKGEVWVPDSARQLQHILYAMAHQGPSGHRGRETTMQHLRGRFHWKNMENDIRTWRAGCLQCVKNAKGDIVPRPLGTQLVAEWPGEILMFDYFEIGPSDSGPTYLLPVSYTHLTLPTICSV